MRLELVRDVGEFLTDMHGTDEEFWPRVLSRHPIAVLGVSLIDRRIHDEQAENKYWFDRNNLIDGFHNYSRIITHEPREQMHPRLRRHLKGKFAGSALWIAGQLIKRFGNRGMSLWHLALAVRFDPLFPLKKRSWWKQRLVSLTLTFILSLLIAVATILIMGSRVAVNYLVDLGIVKENWVLYLLFAGKWILVILLFYFSISVLYFAAPSKRKKWKFFSVGSSVATLSSILFSLGFSNYVNHFGKYNKFYGSLGAIIVLLLWIYFLAIVLLIGFELNSSVQSAALKNDNQLTK